MNVVLNVDEVYTVIALVTAQVIDGVDLSTQGKEAIRRWRREHDVGTAGLNEYVVVFNEAIGNHIDEQTTRMLRRRGKVHISVAEERE